MSSGGVKTRKLRTGELVAYSEAAIRNNASVVEYCRTCMSALSGSTAGVLGLTGFQGFFFFFLTVFVLWILILVKAGRDWEKFFVNRKHLLTGSVFSGLFEHIQTYILFWTFLFGMVHVY